MTRSCECTLPLEWVYKLVCVFPDHGTNRYETNNAFIDIPSNIKSASWIHCAVCVPCGCPSVCHALISFLGAEQCPPNENTSIQSKTDTQFAKNLSGKTFKNVAFSQEIKDEHGHQLYCEWYGKNGNLLFRVDWTSIKSSVSITKEKIKTTTFYNLESGEEISTQNGWVVIPTVIDKKIPLVSSL